MRGSTVLAATILLAPGARAAGECAGAYHEAGRAVAVGPERLGSQGMMVGIWSSKPMTADGSSCFPDVGDGEPAQLDRSSCAALLMLEGCGDAMAEAYSRYPTLNQHWVWPSRTTHPFWSNATNYEMLLHWAHIELSSCHLTCIDRDMLNFAGNNWVLQISVVDSPLLTALPGDLFADMPELEAVSFEHNPLITTLPTALFAPARKMSTVTFWYNGLERVFNGSFASQSQVTELYMQKNKITVVEIGAFAGMTALITLTIDNNLLRAVPAAISLNGLTSLVTLGLNDNLISEVVDGDFAGMPALGCLMLYNNPLMYIDDAVFLGIPAMSVEPEAWPFSANIAGTVIGPQNQTAKIESNLAEATYPPLMLAPIPRACQFIGPNINNVSCDSCGYGYTMLASGWCHLPPFAPRHGWNNSRLLGKYATTVGHVVKRLKSVTLPGPDELGDRKTDFVGYADWDFNAIQYDLEFVPPVDLGCGDKVSVNSSKGPAVRIARDPSFGDNEWDMVRDEFLGYQEHPRYFRIHVTRADTFTFDLCGSSYSSSLTLYTRNASNPPTPGQIPALDYTEWMSQAAKPVGYDLLPMNTASFFSRQSARNPTAQTAIGWTTGCEFGLSAKRTIALTPGGYILETRGTPLFDDPGGSLVLAMECGSATATADAGEDSATSPAAGNPGGLSVDPRTGVIMGAPMRAGSEFDMRLVAKDSSGAKTEISRWLFSVTDPTFRTRPGRTYPPRHSRTRYLVGKTYIVLGPDVIKSRVFVDPENDDYAGIVYHLEVNSSATERAPPNCVVAATDADVTGDSFLTINCTGRYVARLHARDVGGADVSVHEAWAFEVTVADIEVAANGPHGIDCAHGERERVDDIELDDKFTCDCSFSIYWGSNCEHSWLQEALVGNGLFVLVVTLFLTTKRRRRLKLLMKPIDFTRMVTELHDANPMLLGGSGDGDVDELDTFDAQVRVPMELPRRSLNITTKLGEGAFGTVHCAQFKPPRDTTTVDGTAAFLSFAVAVKMLQEDTATAEDDFKREAAISAQFHHAHVVGLLGVVTQGQPRLLVLQLCSRGALDSLLKKEEPGYRELLTFATGIARGMEYLAAKSFVHRDLASRNVLIDEAGEAKVADFGLSRELQEATYYVQSSEAKMPLRWCAPEVLVQQRFSEMSDVWSFGVTLVELYSKAETPYRGWTNAYVLERVQSGTYLPKPEHCPAPIYDNVIRDCFQTDPSERLRFSAIVHELEDPFLFDRRSMTLLSLDSTGTPSQPPPLPGPRPLLRGNSATGSLPEEHVAGYMALGFGATNHVHQKLYPVRTSLMSTGSEYDGLERRTADDVVVNPQLVEHTRSDGVLRPNAGSPGTKADSGGGDSPVLDGVDEVYDQPELAGLDLSNLVETTTDADPDDDDDDIDGDGYTTLSIAGSLSAVGPSRGASTMGPNANVMMLASPSRVVLPETPMDIDAAMAAGRTSLSDVVPMVPPTPVSGGSGSTRTYSALYPGPFGLSASRPAEGSLAISGNAADSELYVDFGARGIVDAPRVVFNSATWNAVKPLSGDDDSKTSTV